MTINDKILQKTLGRLYWRSCHRVVIKFSTSTPLPSTSPARSPYLLCPRGSRYGSPRDKRSPAPPASPAVWWHRRPDLQNLPGHGRDPAPRSRCRFSPPPGSVSWLHSRIWRSHIPTVRGGDHLTIFSCFTLLFINPDFSDML